MKAQVVLKSVEFITKIDCCSTIFLIYSCPLFSHSNRNNSYGLIFHSCKRFHAHVANFDLLKCTHQMTTPLRRMKTFLSKSIIFHHHYTLLLVDYVSHAQPVCLQTTNQVNSYDITTATNYPNQ